MTEQTIPPAEFAIITGSATWGLRFPEDVAEPGVTVLQRDMTFTTPWGPTGEWKLLELDGARTADHRPRRVLCVFSHGWPLDEIDHGAQRRVAWTLQQAGVRRVLACSTLGSLNPAILERDFVIANDVLELTQTAYSLLPGRVRFDCSGKQMICPSCAAVVEATAREFWPSDARVYGTSAGLVAAHSWGPRLQSPAEVTAYRALGADVINHSLAPEATLSREIGACFVNVAFVTAAYLNYFAPVGTNVLGEGVQPTLAPIASRIALHAVAGFDLTADCACGGLKSAQDPRHFSER
jgi:5'-methylthioadenosine phosphorylase